MSGISFPHRHRSGHTGKLWGGEKKKKIFNFRDTRQFFPTDSGKKTELWCDDSCCAVLDSFYQYPNVFLFLLFFLLLSILVCADWNFLRPVPIHNAAKKRCMHWRTKSISRLPCPSSSSVKPFLFRRSHQSDDDVGSEENSRIKISNLHYSTLPLRCTGISSKSQYIL